MAPRIYELTVRVDGQSGAVATQVRDDGHLASSNPHHILLLVHGYNNAQQDAERSYDTFIGNILNAIGSARVDLDAIAKFHWPGDESTILGSTVGYPFDINHARDAAARLADYLTQIPVPTLRVTLVGHSMGCRLILEALGRITSATPDIGLVGLMAAASPVDFVRRGARLFRTGNPPRKVLKYFSEQDRVLQIAFPLGQWAAYQYQIEDDNYSEAIGRFGHPPEYASGVPTRNGHSDYWPDRTIAADIAQRIAPMVPRTTPVAALPTRSLETSDRLAPRALPTRSLPT